MTTPSSERVAPVPIWADVHLTHAALQAVAEAAGVDILHIKGPTDAALRSALHLSTDADVLVRPAHLGAFIAALTARGWSLHTDFDEGSPFGHAANFAHESWAWVDVHRAMPGFRRPAEEVFDVLWRERQELQIGHWPCTVASPRGQVLIQTVHVARAHGRDRPETWTNCPDELRPRVRELAAELGAATAFAAGIGELELHRGSGDYALWKYWAGPRDDRLAEWVVRLRMAGGSRARLGVLAQLIRVNRTHLRMKLGHEPSGREVAWEQFTRLGKAARAAILAAGRRLRGYR